MKLYTPVFTFFLLLFSFTAKCQLDKGIWLVGGSGNFYASKNTYAVQSSSYYAESNDLTVKISPTIGYFIADKFVVGLKPFFTWYKSHTTTPGGGNENEKRYGIGPFLRYYFLEKEKQFNILAETSYQHGFYSFISKGKSNIFSIAAGPVIYFNSSVGLEFLIGYSSIKENIDLGANTTKKGLDVGIGFQFYLQKK